MDTVYIILMAVIAILVVVVVTLRQHLRDLQERLAAGNKTWCCMHGKLQGYMMPVRVMPDGSVEAVLDPSERRLLPNDPIRAQIGEPEWYNAMFDSKKKVISVMAFGVRYHNPDFL